MLKRILPIVSAARGIPARMPTALQPLMRMSGLRKLLLGLLLMVAVAAITWWLTGERIAAAIAAGLALAIILAFVAIEMLARRLSRSHARAWELEEAKAASISEQATNWIDQTKQLRSLGVDTSAVPIFLLIGEAGAGKTSSLKQADLVHPFGPEPALGDGGTRHCLMHFTDAAWVIDTAGRYVISGQLDDNAQEDRGRKVDEAEWLSFLGRLRRFRPRAPINGVIVAIPADALLEDDQDVRRRKAMLLRKAMNELRVRLGVSFPVTVMITKADRIGGFSEYFEHLKDPQALRQLLGWSPKTDAAGFDVADYRRGVAELTARFRHRRLGVIEASSRTASAERTRRIHSFPEEFAALAEPLESYLQTMLASDRYFGALRLRGFFLTSSLQEGAPALRACEQLLGCSVEVPAAVERRNRTLFVHDFYTKKVFRECGMVVPTSRAGRASRTINRIALAATIVLLLAVGAMALHEHRTLRTDLLGSDGVKELSEKLVGLPGASLSPDSDLRASIARLRQLGDVIQAIEEGERVVLGAPSMLGSVSRESLLDHLKRLHADRFIAIACRTLPAAVRSAIEDGALCNHQQRSAVFQSILAIAAAHVDGDVPSAEAVVDTLGLLGDPPSDEDIQSLRQERARCVAWSSPDALHRAVRAAVDTKKVELLVAALQPGAERKCDGILGSTPGAAGLPGLSEQLSHDWDRLVRNPNDRQVLGEFLLAINDVQRRLTPVTPSDDSPDGDPAPLETFVARLRKIVGASPEDSRPTMDGLLAPFASIVDRLGSGASPGRVPESEWVDFGSEPPRLSQLAEDRRRAAIAMQSLQRQYDLLVGAIDLKPGRPDSNEYPLETVLQMIDPQWSSDLDSFRGTLNEFSLALGALREQASAIGSNGDAADDLARRILDQFVLRLGSSADEVLAAGSSSPNGLSEWRAFGPLDRVRDFAIPSAEAVRDWRDRGLADQLRVASCVDSIDHAVVVMIERLLEHAQDAIPTASGSPLDWRLWMPQRAGQPPTPSEVKRFLEQTMADYDEIFGTAQSSMPFEACRQAGLSRAASKVESLRSLLGGPAGELAASIDQLVSFTVTIEGVLDQEPASWIEIWSKNAELLASMRPVSSTASPSAPRSTVADRLRAIAASIEKDLRTRLGQVVAAQLQVLSSRLPHGSSLFGGDGPTRDAQIHAWFKLADQFEADFGIYLNASDGSDGRPLAQLDDSVADWLALVRAWRSFLYADGAPDQGFAQRRVEIRLTEWPFDDPFLSIGVDERVFRFNARMLAIEIEDALSISKIVVKPTNRNGDGVRDGETLVDEALAILELHEDGEIEIGGRRVRVNISFPDAGGAPPRRLGPPGQGPLMAGGTR